MIGEIKFSLDLYFNVCGTCDVNLSYCLTYGDDLERKSSAVVFFFCHGKRVISFVVLAVGYGVFC